MPLFDGTPTFRPKQPHSSRDGSYGGQWMGKMIVCLWLLPLIAMLSHDVFSDVLETRLPLSGYKVVTPTNVPIRQSTTFPK
jgi:hypothetical protein